ncbi:hypothetical protein [Staphylococcus epidermidis]|nr:hypothetical protein [Staphylococcus epidermidis]
MPGGKVDCMVVKLMEGEEAVVEVDDEEGFFKLGKGGFGEGGKRINNK